MFAVLMYYPKIVFFFTLKRIVFSDEASRRGNDTGHPPTAVLYLYLPLAGRYSCKLQYLKTYCEGV